MPGGLRLGPVAVAAAALAVGVPSAAYATSFPVTVWGSSVAATYGFTATVVSPGATFALSGANVTCGVSAMSGAGDTVTAGSLVDPVLSFGAVSFGVCTSGSAVTLLSTGHFVADSGVTPGSDAVVGRATDLTAKFTAAVPALCTYIVSGEADATYNEATGALAIAETGFTGDVEVVSVTGCGGLVSVGDPMNIAATYRLGAVGGTGFVANAINIG